MENNLRDTRTHLVYETELKSNHYSNYYSTILTTILTTILLF